MILQPKKIFLLDAIGAMLSAFLLGVVFVYFQSYIGMPLSVLHSLALVAAVFAVYSTSCYWLVKTNWKPYLIFIASINSLYGIASIILVIYHYELLDPLGLIYFIVELVIITIIIYLEFRTIKKMR